MKALACCLFFAALSAGFDQYQRESEKLNDLMHWEPGEVIAEIGAGEGKMAFAAAAAVAPAGRVYITELDEAKLAHLQAEAKKHDSLNVVVLKAGAVDTKLPENCCNDIFMRRVYHHFTNPGGTDASILRALKPGGLLAVIDFTPRRSLAAVEGVPANREGHGIPKDVLVDELKSAGFEIVRAPEDWPDDGDYCVIARKPQH